MKMNAVLMGLCAVGVLGACGGAPPEATVVLTTNTTPPPPPCTEEWVHMPVHIGFPTGGTEMDQQNRLILNEMVQTAMGRPDLRRVRVEGHTDTCGNEMSNMALSQNRAVSVGNELVQMGVPSERIETVGYGSTQPLGEEACGPRERLTRQVNRRVEFTLLVCR